MTSTTRALQPTSCLARLMERYRPQQNGLADHVPVTELRQEVGKLVGRIKQADRLDKIASAPQRRCAAAKRARDKRYAGGQVETVGLFYEFIRRSQHVAMIKTAAGFENTENFREYFDNTQMPRGPLQRYDVEIVVGKRQAVDVADRGIDVKVAIARQASTDPLHRLALVDGVDFEARFAS